MQAQYEHSPPTSSASISTAVSPPRTTRSATFSPTAPAPITMTSNSRSSCAVMATAYAGATPGLRRAPGSVRHGTGARRDGLCRTWDLRYCEEYGRARRKTMTTAGAMPPARFSAQARLRALQADIIELILERELVTGDPLPTENELAAALGVGRNTLRESLKVLQALGVIEIRHGFGMFVAAEQLRCPDRRAHLPRPVVAAAPRAGGPAARGCPAGTRSPAWSAAPSRRSPRNSSPPSRSPCSGWRPWPRPGSLPGGRRGVPPPAVRAAEQRPADQPAGGLLEGLPQDPRRARRHGHRGPGGGRPPRTGESTRPSRRRTRCWPPSG